MLDFFASPQVAQRLMQRERANVLSHIPVKSRQNVYLHPWHLSMDETAKYGAAGKWPSTVAIRTHFPSVVRRGFESEKEALEVKYPEELYGKDMDCFCSQYIDGHAKAVMIHGVFALLDYLAPCCQFASARAFDSEEVGPHDIPADDGVLDLIASLKYIRVNFNRFEQPEHCIYEALSAGLRCSDLWAACRLLC